jgi:hypothetical protein
MQNRNGIYVCYHGDFSDVVVFNHEDELEAQRYANEHHMLIMHAAPASRADQWSLRS